MLQVNQAAPAFNSPNQHNEMVSLADFAGTKNVVLFFYPKDDTPGCTIEANEFTALVDDFAAHDTVVIGVSKDDCGSHQAFIDKFGLKVDLLADTSGEVCDAYGVSQEQGFVRSTFIINKDGLLVEALYNVDPRAKHAQAMLDVVKQL